MAGASASTTHTAHQAADCTTQDSSRLRSRQSALGGRTNALLATPTSAPTHPLRTLSRDPPSLPQPRLLPDLPPSPPRFILLEALSRRVGGASGAHGRISWRRGRRRHAACPEGDPLPRSAWLLIPVGAGEEPFRLLACELWRLHLSGS